MVRRLKKTYFSLLAPAAAGFLLVFGLKTAALAPHGLARPPQAVGILLFVLSMVFAVAAPIFMRTLFAHRVRRQRKISESDLTGFERRLIRVALAAPYCSLAAYCLELPGFYFNGSFLAALYAVYYYFPSQKRVDFEKKLFRV